MHSCNAPKRARQYNILTSNFRLGKINQTHLPAASLKQEHIYPHVMSRDLQAN